MILEYKKLGANVQKYRKIVGLTQEQLEKSWIAQTVISGKSKTEEEFPV